MKRVLFFTYDFPYPTNSGGKVRAYNLLKFANRNCIVTLFSFTRPDFKNDYIPEMKKIGIKYVETFKRNPVRSLKNIKSIFHPASSIFKYLYYSKDIEKKLHEAIQEQKIEVVHFESLYVSYYISDTIHAMGVKQIYGTENIEYRNYEEFAKKVFPGVNIPIRLQVKKIKREEESFARAADATLAVTEKEAEYFKKAGAKKTFVIPNGVDIDKYKFRLNTHPAGSKMLFVGNFSYFPNRDAIEFFYKEVFKNLREDYTLTIIGKHATKLKIHDKRVTCIDYVPDIREAYYNADIMVSPVRIGGGTNFKIIEAMACGLPVIAHPARIEGLELIPDEHLLVAKTSEEFSERITMLLQNDGLQGRLAKSARAHIEKNYSWQEIGKKINKIWLEL